MAERFVSRRALPEFSLWAALGEKRVPVGFDLETTARCNLNCRHCYINVPAGDRAAKRRELDPAEIERVGSDAASLGAIWCAITGGEPLLRRDFADIYLALRRKGLLLSVYTNATLVGRDVIELFRKHPPRDIEVTVYGVTEATYERVTRVPGSFAAFRRGLDLLLGSGVKVRLKAMALRSNFRELPAIAEFCRARTKDYFRFDPFLHYRFDRDAARNAEIESERLTPAEVVSVERSDRERRRALEKSCKQLIVPALAGADGRRLFRCDAGRRSFVVGADGRFRPCPSLCHPDFLYDLRKGSLAAAWNDFVPAVLGRTSDRSEYHEKCGRCPVVNLCLWCPAHAYLETGVLDLPVDKFCRLAQARARALGRKAGKDVDKAP
ncbi:MAG TPA: radical SAM protein [Burkholderiales bacterium]|nr:radical SAM protein [Burkholderiales bacterium]